MERLGPLRSRHMLSKSIHLEQLHWGAPVPLDFHSSLLRHSHIREL